MLLKKKTITSIKGRWCKLKLKGPAKKKQLCLDKIEPEIESVPYSQHCNWEEKSDLKCAPALENSRIKLGSDQQIDTNHETKSPANQRDRVSVYQRTASKLQKRYRLLNSKIISEYKHTIKLRYDKYGSELRKRAIATQPKLPWPAKN